MNRSVAGTALPPKPSAPRVGSCLQGGTGRGVEWRSRKVPGGTAIQPKIADRLGIRNNPFANEYLDCTEGPPTGGPSCCRKRF